MREELAIRAQVFHRVVEDIQACNASADPDEMQTLIDSTVREVRAECDAKARADKD